MVAHTIWVINKYASGHEDGFETRTMAIAREWAITGHQVVVISSNANHLTGNREQAHAVENRVTDGVRVIRVRSRRYQKTASAGRVLSWLDFERRLLRADLTDLPRPDVVIASSLSLFSVVSGSALARRYRCPWVFEVRDIWPLTLVEEGGVNSWNPFAMLLARLERFGYANAALTIGTMPNLAAHAHGILGRPIPVGCIPFGFDPTAAPAELPIPPRGAVDGRLVVGYAGSIGVSNALETLVECARRLRSDNRFRFVFAGEGDRRKAFMDATGDCPNVTWLGRLPRGDVHTHLSACDLLYFAAHPSKVWEFGLSLNKLTDYLLAARPVLGSYSGFPTILDEAGCGQFVPAANADALVQALHCFHEMSPSERAAMGARGRQWLFANRTWKRLAADYLQLLEPVIPRHHALAQAR